MNIIFVVATKTVAVLNKISDWYRKYHFRYQVFYWNGKLEIAKSVYFAHHVRFQGRGYLRIEKDVTLGVKVAGSSTLPILLQPREPEALIKIGQGSVIVNGSELVACTSISIGKNCLVGPQTMIFDSDFHSVKPEERRSTGLSDPVIIEDNVWFGSRVMVLKGVHIGCDAVIGAGCIVTKDIPAGGIAVGNPMKIIGSVYA